MYHQYDDIFKTKREKYQEYRSQIIFDLFFSLFSHLFGQLFYKFSICENLSEFIVANFCFTLNK